MQRPHLLAPLKDDAVIQHAIDELEIQFRKQVKEIPAWKQLLAEYQNTQNKLSLTVAENFDEWWWLQEECVRLNKRIDAFSRPDAFIQFRKQSNAVAKTFQLKTNLKPRTSTPHQQVPVATPIISSQTSLKPTLNKRSQPTSPVVGKNKRNVKAQQTHEAQLASVKQVAVEVESASSTNNIVKLDTVNPTPQEEDSEDNIVTLNMEDALTTIKNLNLMESTISTPCFGSKIYCADPLCKTPLLYRPKESKVICPKCHKFEMMGDVNAGSFSQSSGDNEPTTYAYDRPTHWMDTIEPFRPFKKVHFQNELFDAIKGVLRLNRFGLKEELTFATLFMILKVLGLKQHYKDRYQLTMVMNNRFWPIISEDQERVSTMMFILMQNSYEQKKKKKKRSSFLNYDQSGYQIFRYLGWYNCLEFFPLLETKCRYIEQVMLIREVFEDNGLDTSTIS